MIRPHVAGEVRGRFSGTVGYRGLVPVEAMPSLPDPTPLQFWAGPRRHLLHYAIDGGRTVNFLAVVRVPEWTADTWMEECEVSDAVDAFAGWHPAVTEMVGATDVGARWALYDLAPLERWHTDRVVLMGDAAHAMVPHQGQGANQTIEDAIALADCLADADDLALGAARTTRSAGASARPECSAGRAAPADLMHLPDGPEIAPRDALFRELDSELAWIHAYDAHAAHGSAAAPSTRAPRENPHMPTATAAVLSANHEPFVLEEIEVESPQRDEVLVRIVATGLCHTDLSARRGSSPSPCPASWATRARAWSRRSATTSPTIDRTLEATGVPAVLRQAIDVVAPLGVCGIVGAPAPDADVSMNILTAIVKGSRVVGINQGDAVRRESIPALVELHRQGRFRSTS